MWLFTVDGFYSCVLNSRGPGLLIRGRDLGHMEAARDRLAELGVKAKVIARPRADYPYRIEVCRKHFLRWLEELGKDVIYGNFKAEVLAKHGPGEYHDLLYAIWEGAREIFSPRREGGTHEEDV